MKRSLWIAALLGTLLGALCGLVPACAGYSEFIIENDYLAPRNHDRWYTDGWRLSYSESYKGSDIYYIGQHMYTPDDTGNPNYIPTDRRYGGWLYGGIRSFVDWGGTWFTYDVNIGVIGKYSYSEETQKLIHRALGCGQPMGWDHQIPSRFAFQFAYNQYLWDIKYDYAVLALGCDLAVGNVVTSVGLGAYARVGLNPDTVRTPFNTISVKSNRWRLYLECSVVSRRVFYDVFIWESDVKAVDYVTDGNVNLTLETPYRYALFYGYTYRTRQFETQKEPAQFGAVGIRVNY